MECVAGIAALGGLGAKKVFDYNRENFMYDRRLRMRKEFQLQKFRIAQAELWREDVRDLISLTEYKMHIYLLVNVLLLGFTIVLWCQGRLPSDTPDWLMMGFSLGITGAFMFLLLAMWLAMHAAVAAQSYEARLLTQLIRLPIPSWQEVEACRTYGSQFEHVQGRQLLRVPFLAGRQEQLVAPPEEAAAEGEAPPADPWGHERPGDGIAELGCQHGSQVARLRHIKLARQAMVYWQSYDAFSRISLSVGINQLLLALSYYILGYILVEVGCRTAATYGVLLLCVLAEAMAKLDMSLSIWQLRQMQFLFAFGPIVSCVAAYHWSVNSFESLWFAEVFIILSFLSHGLLIMLMIRFCCNKAQDNGTMLPTAFRGVLYLDVFGWLKTTVLPGVDDLDRRPSASSGVGGGDPQAPAGAEGHAQGPQADAPGGPAESLHGHSVRAPEEESVDDLLGRPALQAVGFAGGRPAPCRPQDFAPREAAQDLRDVPGAPSVSGRRAPGESSSTEFYDAASWLSAENGDDHSSEAGDPELIVTGHEKEVPRTLPWRMFCTFAVILAAAWFAASLYHILGASRAWDFDIPMSWESHEDVGVQSEDALVVGNETTAASTMSLLAIRGLGLVGSSGWRYARPERVPLSWPHPNVKPVGLSCDVAGRRFVVTDGLLLYASAVDNGIATGRSTKRSALRSASTRGQPLPAPALVFAEVQCPAIGGEGIQDATVACTEEDSGKAGVCEALVLHRHGRRIHSCRLGEGAAAAGTGQGAEQGAPGTGKAGYGPMKISDTWLERRRSRQDGDGSQDGGSGPRGHYVPDEKAVAIAADTACRSPSVQNCTIIGTTHGRVVQLEQHWTTKQLVPADVLHHSTNNNGSLPLKRGTVRSLGNGYLGILQDTPGRQSIKIIDGSNTGLTLGRLWLPPLRTTAAFCVAQQHLYMLLQGPSPGMWRVPIPDELMPAVPQLDTVP
mmetsp:Transcript_44671/g.127438  ORF Transcript_44671/g.127438 Transcript_44671/m.127438 type:complete len:957 (+) Transcript_44671:208-3078(+)|eukprot:CAMPEP_0168358132 /NCGR_PEP_ID=MMETSP0228-20121227/952_1 /TAXON_ID=133427 /ORGANISM="Protoceratium reticulatum, Strain CCCM 535 (=CCMP 1889)" /LENGTH=956 /DNA_ID=CAMNT_0008370687 /DNA_START=123 /DNA_END=2993 /DNA_ORIENTATION=+